MHVNIYQGDFHLQPLYRLSLSYGTFHVGDNTHPASRYYQNYQNNQRKQEETKSPMLTYNGIQTKWTPKSFQTPLPHRRKVQKDL